jgi:hypothetical protein
MIGSGADYNSQGRSAEDRQRSVQEMPLFFYAAEGLRLLSWSPFSYLRLTFG